MELKNQVCSLELALKLRELGVPQESLYWWAEEKLTGWNNQDWTWKLTGSLYEGDYEHYRNPVSAFTVAELGEMLPVDVSFKLSDGRWSVFYKKVNGTFISKEADTEADARAKTLIYLLENNLITPTRKEGV